MARCSIYVQGKGRCAEPEDHEGAHDPKFSKVWASVCNFHHTWKMKMIERKIGKKVLQLDVRVKPVVCTTCGETKRQLQKNRQTMGTRVVKVVEVKDGSRYKKKSRESKRRGVTATST